MTPRRFVFATWEGGGNAPPLLAVARGLAARGHEVRVLADPVLGPDVAAAGAEPVAWTRAPHRHTRSLDSDFVRDWEARTPAGAFARLRERLACGAADAFAADVGAELERRPADVVVGDLPLFGAAVAAEAAGLPYAAVIANPFALPDAGVPPLGTGWRPARGPVGRARDALGWSAARALWDRGLPALNEARTARGLAPLASVLDILDRIDRLVVLTSPALEFPQYAPPANVRVVGAVLDDPGWVEQWTPPPGDDPLVLVGLSTTFQGQLGALRNACAALGSLPVRGVVTTGPAVDPEALRAPSNVTVVRSAPHAAVLREASAAVTHAGHGTLIKALAAGVPAVCLPMGRDQPDNAARAVARGAAVRVRPGARPRAITAAIRRLLDDPGYREAAGRVGAAIGREDAVATAAAELEALAPRPAPAPLA